MLGLVVVSSLGCLVFVRSGSWTASSLLPWLPLPRVPSLKVLALFVHFLLTLTSSVLSSHARLSSATVCYRPQKTVASGPLLRTLLWIKLRACKPPGLLGGTVTSEMTSSPPLQVAFRPVIQPTTRSLLARLTPHQVAHSTSHAPIWPHQCPPYPPCKARIYFRRTCFSAPPHTIIVSCACASTESSQHEFDEITHAWSIRVLSALAHRIRL